MGPGLLSGIGQLLQPSKHPQPKAPNPSSPGTARPNAFKNGGKVEKTGLALVHKDETIIPAPKKGDSDSHSGTETVRLSKHRAMMHLHKGGLHRALGIPEDQDIPQDKLEKAKHSDNPHVREMANLAGTMEGWKKK